MIVSEQHSPAVAEDSRPREIFAPSRWRRLVVYARDNKIAVLEGNDVTVDSAIEDLRDSYAHALGRETAEGYWARQSAGEWARVYNDVCLWEGDKLVAVFRPLPDGSAEVTRYDRPAVAGTPDWLASVVREALLVGPDEARRRMLLA